MSRARDNKASKRAKRLVKLEGWDRCIADVEYRIEDLQYSLSVYRAAKERGDPFPLPASRVADSGGQCITIGPVSGCFGAGSRREGVEGGK